MLEVPACLLHIPTKVGFGQDSIQPYGMQVGSSLGVVLNLVQNMQAVFAAICCDTMSWIGKLES
jgi:hypothetical protein